MMPRTAGVAQFVVPIPADRVDRFGTDLIVGHHDPRTAAIAVSVAAAADEAGADVIGGD